MAMGFPRQLEWVAISSLVSWASPALQVVFFFFLNWATGKAIIKAKLSIPLWDSSGNWAWSSLSYKLSPFLQRHSKLHHVRIAIIRFISAFPNVHFSFWVCYTYIYIFSFSSVQFSCSVVSDSLWPHGLQYSRLPCPSPTPEPTQTHVHCIRDAIQPSRPLSSPSSPAFNLLQHQGLFQWVSFSHQVAKVLGFHVQHQSFQWIFRPDFL